MASLTIQSRASKIGLAVIRSSDDSCVLKVLVASKYFAERASSFATVERDVHNRTVISAFLVERGKLHIEVPKESVEALREFSQQQDGRNDGGDRIWKYLGVRILVDGVDSGGNTDAQSADERDKFVSHFRDLIWLMYRMRRLEPAVEQAHGSESQGGLELDPSRTADDQLTILVEIAFVDEVARLIHAIRQDYIPVTELCVAIKGRVSDRSVAKMAYEGWPRLECNFDEFAEVIPLFRVIATALDVVVSGELRQRSNLPDKWLGGHHDPRELRERLRNIPSFPRAVARSVATSIRLTPLQRVWKRTLDAARRILDAEAAQFGQAQNTGSTLILSLNMSSGWERIVASAIGSESPAATSPVSNDKPDHVIGIEQSGMTDPWGRDTPITVDLAAFELRSKSGSVDIDVVLVDAKYVELQGRGKEKRLALPPSNLYQIFVYSLMFKPRPRQVVLVYPMRENQVIAKGELTLKRAPLNIQAELKTEDAGQCSLRIVRARFPTSQDVYSEEGWHKYSENLKQAIMMTIRDGVNDAGREPNSTGREHETNTPP
jgi:5-methylcytosine-specific restriction endonuclease McrBC regulatory subunit McrC